MRRIAEATKGSDRGSIDAGFLATIMARVGRLDEAEGMFRQIMQEAEARGLFRVATTAASYLANLLVSTGRPAEALAVVGKMKELTRRAGLGPWTQLGDEAQHLQILCKLGRYKEVLEAVEALRKQMQEMPGSGEAGEATEPWQVRESILDAGHSAALALERWEEALALNREIAQLKEGRDATALELAKSRFNDYGPLLRLGRYAEARELLLECRGALEEASDAGALGKVFGAQADLEDQLGHNPESIRYEQAALRYSYHAGEPGDCSISHHNLSNYLLRGGSSRAALAHRTAAAVIDFQTSDGGLGRTLAALSRELAAFAPSPPPLPGNFDELCGAVEQVEGVRFRELFSRLPTDKAGTGDEALQRVIELARAIPG